MLPRLIGPRGRMFLAGQLLTIAPLAALGFGLESVSPGWWGFTKGACLKLAGPADIGGSADPELVIFLHGLEHKVLKGPTEDRELDGAAFSARQTFMLTDSVTIKAVVTNPKVQKLDLIRDLDPKVRQSVVRSWINVQTSKIGVATQVTVTCRTGSREDKVAILKALTNSFKERSVENLERMTAGRITFLKSERDELAVRAGTLKKLKSARFENQVPDVELAAVERLMARISDEIELARLNKLSPSLVEIISEPTE